MAVSVLLPRPASVTGWRRLRGLPLVLVDSVASLVASLSGQNLASGHDLYKREATCEYSFGLRDNSRHCQYQRHPRHQHLRLAWVDTNSASINGESTMPPL